MLNPFFCILGIVVSLGQYDLGGEWIVNGCPAVLHDRDVPASLACGAELQRGFTARAGDLDNGGLAVTGTQFHLWEALAVANVRGDQHMEEQVTGRFARRLDLHPPGAVLRIASFEGRVILSIKDPAKCCLLVRILATNGSGPNRSER